MARNVEIRERVGGVFNHADSLLYPKTHVSMVEGLLTNGKLSLGLLPDPLKTGLKYIGLVESSGSSLADTLAEIDGWLPTNGKDTTASGSGCWLMAGQDLGVQGSTGHVLL